MSLQFILGRAYADREGEIVNQIADLLQEGQDAPIFYIVPDHMKFESELHILQRLHEHPAFKDKAYLGMIQLQVLSFNRLAWYLLQDQAVFQERSLSDAGLSMLIQKILFQLSEQGELRLFKGQIYQQGFIEKLRELFKELRQGNFDSDSLADSLEKALESDEDASFSLKLSELSLIYQAFLGELVGNFVEEEDILQALIDYFNSGQASRAHVFVNHFDSFNSQESQVLLAMMKQTSGLTVSLKLDQAYQQEPLNQSSVFYIPARSYHQLFELARDHQVEVKEDVLLEQDLDGHFSDVESIFSRSQLDLLQEDFSGQVNPHIHLWKADNKQAEILHLAGQIRRLVHQGGYRYQDILVLSRKVKDYQAMMGPIFDRHDIPYFIDHAYQMSQHPFAEFLSLLMKVKRYYYRQSDVIHLLKTDFLIGLTKDDRVPSQEKDRFSFIQDKSKEFRRKVDILENYVLQYGIDGYEWLQEEDWTYVDVGSGNEQAIEDQAIANDVKAYLQSILSPLYRAWDQAENNQEAARALYVFLEREHVPEILLTWRDLDIEEGQLERAREYEQIWRVFINVLDEWVDILGEEDWQEDLFYDILQTAFKQAKYANVPPAIDQVVVTDLARLPGHKAKVVFILSLDDESLPLKVNNDSLLTDEDRAQLNQASDDDQYIKEYGKLHYAQESYVAYQALTHASEELYLSYAAMDEDNQQVKPSPYYERVQDYFNLTAETKGAALSHLQDSESEDITTYLSSKQEGFGQVLSSMRQGIQDGQAPSDTVLDVYAHFLSDREEGHYRRLAESLTYQNIPKALDQSQASALYGEDLYLSVSQLESYYLDPFSHFLNYGLRLKERPVMELTALESGDFFHDGLDELVQTLVKKQIDIERLTEEELETLVQSVTQNLLKKSKYSLFTKTGRMQFIAQQLTQSIRQLVWAMKLQTAHSGFQPVATELSFGFTPSAIASKSYPLDQDRQIHLRGKIDRVDAWDIDSDRYYAVVDYKSGARRLDESDIYYGLSLQLMTYLNVVLDAAQEKEGKKAKPGGAFYSRVHNPMLTLHEDLSEEEIEKERVKKFRLTGLLVEEEPLVEAIEERLEFSEPSSFIPVSKKKKGGLTSSRLFKTPQDLQTIFDYTDHLIIKAGRAILSGDTRLQPYEDQPFTSSIQGEYRAISQFDAMLEENNYRQRGKKTIQDMKEVLEEDKEED